MTTTTGARVAGVIVALEAVGLVVLAVFEVAAIVSGDTESVASAVALAVLIVVGSAAVMAFAVAIWQGLSWGRSGGIVTQVLILAVAFGAATGAYANPQTALLLAVPAVTALVLLLLAARAAGRAKAANDS